MKTVKEVSRMTGLSIRALHHYDAIGLLPPSSTTAAGYRMYDDAALERIAAALEYNAAALSSHWEQLAAGAQGAGQFSLNPSAGQRPV